MSTIAISLVNFGDVVVVPSVVFGTATVLSMNGKGVVIYVMVIVVVVVVIVVWVYDGRGWRWGRGCVDGHLILESACQFSIG